MRKKTRAAVVVLLFAVALPIAAFFGYRRFVACVRTGKSGVRLRQYRRGALVQWSLAALAIAAWYSSGRAFEGLGLGFPIDWRSITVTVFALSVGAFRRVGNRCDLFRGLITL